MKSLAFATSVLVILSAAAAAQAAGINMENPHRALGREGDIRVDAELVLPVVSPGTPIAVRYQVQNFSGTSVALADRVSDASYDADTRTITVGIGSEVPPDGNLPHIVLISPGEKKVFRAAATPMLNAAAIRRSAASAPRFVQIKVAIIRDVQPFVSLIERQQRGPQRFPDELFDAWFESTETILLNSVPVEWKPIRTLDAEDRSAARGSF